MARIGNYIRQQKDRLTVKQVTYQVGVNIVGLPVYVTHFYKEPEGYKNRNAVKGN